MLKFMRSMPLLMGQAITINCGTCKACDCDCDHVSSAFRLISREFSKF